MTDNRLPTEEYCRRINPALAEMGYGGNWFWTECGQMFGNPPIPHAVLWQAFFIAKAGDPHPCWACWSTAMEADPFTDDERCRWASDCVTDRRGGCHFPEGPARPPRELLASA